MTQITFQNGQILMRDGKVGTEQGCCCGQPCTCANCHAWGLKVGDVCIAQGVRRNQEGFAENLNPIADCPGNIFEDDSFCKGGDPYGNYNGSELPFCWIQSYGFNGCGSEYCQWVDDGENPDEWPITAAPGGPPYLASRTPDNFVWVKQFGECDAGGQFLLDGIQSYECLTDGHNGTGEPSVECGIMAYPCICCDGTTIRVRIYYVHVFLYTYPWQNTQYCQRYFLTIGNVYYRDYEGPFPACDIGEVEIPPVSDFVLVDIATACTGVFQDPTSPFTPIWGITAALNQNLYEPEKATGPGQAGDCGCDPGPVTLSCGPLPACLVQEFP
jgi:hypothetical protein